MSKFLIRDYLPEDLRGIAALQSAVDPELQLSEEQYTPIWRWLCERNPNGNGKILVAVDDAGKIVAHECMVRFPVADQVGRKLTAGFPCLLVVAHEFRRVPLFFQLELRLAQQYPAAGIDFAFTIVRDYILRAHLALGFRRLGLLPVYARPYRLRRLAGRYLGDGVMARLAAPLLRVAELPFRVPPARRVGCVEIVAVDEFDEKFAEDIAPICASLGIHTQRTAAMLNWRFRQCPGRDYQVYAAREQSAVRGYIALRRIPMHEFDALAIVDLLFPPEQPKIGRALLLAAHRTALEMGVDLAAGVFNPHSALLPVLKRFGYLKTPEGFSLITHQPAGATPFTEDTFRAWHYTWFEHDYV